MQRKILSIDPGLTGAICLLDYDANILVLETCPTKMVGGKRKYDEVAIKDLLKKCGLNSKKNNKPSLWVEDVHAYKNSGKLQAFSFGYGKALWIMAAVIYEAPLNLVLPQTWKKEMMEGYKKKDKNASILKAKLLAGAQADLFKDHNQAEAFLIGLYGLRKERGTL